MRILLINPNNPLNCNDAMINIFVGVAAPMGLLKIAAVLLQKKHEVKFFDQYVEYKSKNQIFEFMRNEHPDVVGISVIAPTFSWVKELCYFIRKELLQTKIVLGNSFASLYAQEILRDEVADVVVFGEGEYSMPEVVESLQENRPLTWIAGIAFRQGEEVVITKQRAPISDLDALPYPAWNLININNYNRVPMLGLYGPSAMIQGSRGCAYHCFYCSQDATFRKFRKRSIVSIVDEMEYLYEHYHVPNIIFLDAYFPFSIQSGFEFCDEVIRRGLHEKVRWVTETKVDQVNEALLKRMKEAGLYLIMYGFETGSERILAMINKNTCLEQAHEAMKYTKKYAIKTLGLFMIGFPEETEEEVKKTIRFSQELDCDLVKYNLLIPYPGTGLYERYFSDRLFAYKNPDLFNSWYDMVIQKHDVFNCSVISVRRLRQLRIFAILSYYLRLRVLLRLFIKRTLRVGMCYKVVCFLLYISLRGKKQRKIL
ncbi:MAG: cobalamin B12-binding domain-containing protein [Candidatus Omnitrophica bacterium]|nr:cobalamin B12-binding domain-containing protein [Candidatus Omnitrophota bacterium]